MATLDDEKRVSLQNSRVIHAKINVLDFDFQIVGEITGSVLEGSSYTIDATSDIRRTCSVSIVVADSTFDIAYGSKIWLDKYIQIFIGIEDLENYNEVVYSNIGIFLIDNPKQMYDAVTNTLSINGVDLMSKMTGLRNGYLEGITYQIKANTNIRNAMISLVKDECGFKQYSIDLPHPTPLTPSDLSFGLGSTAYNIIAQLRDINSNYQTYFDPNGVYRFDRIPSGDDEQVMVDDNIWNKVLISYSKETNFEEVKNYIEVFGKTQADGHTPYGIACDTNPQSPFFIGIDNENVIRIVLSGGEYDNIFPLSDYETSESQFNSLAQQRADYELYLRCKLQDTLELVCVPLYWLDVNWLVNITLPNKKADGSSEEEVQQYIIKRISTNLDVSGTQNISLMKYYPLDIGSIVYNGTAQRLFGTLYKLSAASNDTYAIFSGYSIYANAYDENLVRRMTSNSLKRYKPLALSFNNHVIFAGGGKPRTSDIKGYNNVWGYNDTLTKTVLPNLDTEEAEIGHSGTVVTNDGHEYMIISTGQPSESSTIANVYDEEFTKIGNVPKLSTWRKYGAATTIGNYGIFFGGEYDRNQRITNVDIYDNYLTHTVIPLNNVQQKANLVSTTIGNHALFVGGWYYNNTASSTKHNYSSAIICFDENLTQTQFTYSKAQVEDLATTNIGNYAVFAGGAKYGSSNNTMLRKYTWLIDKDLVKSSVTGLSEKRCGLAGATIGDYVLFGGGVDSLDNKTDATNYKIVDVYSRI